MSDVVRIIGNAPSAAEGISEKFKGTYIGLNAAPAAFAETSVACDICWVQDWRFFSEKKALLQGSEIKLDSIEFYVVDYVDTHGLKLPKLRRVRSLGRDGFSFNPDRGVFEGRSAAYGAVQLALRIQPKRIELYGVDFTYRIGGSRFYQGSVGWDLDLHIHEKQISEMNRARQLIEAEKGIEVVFGTASHVDTYIEAHPKV